MFYSSSTCWCRLLCVEDQWHESGPQAIPLIILNAQSKPVDAALGQFQKQLQVTMKYSNELPHKCTLMNLESWTWLVSPGTSVGICRLGHGGYISVAAVIHVHRCHSMRQNFRLSRVGKKKLAVRTHYMHSFCPELKHWKPNINRTTRG